MKHDRRHLIILMRTRATIAVVAVLMAMLTACNNRPHEAQKVSQQPDIYPDYIGVTIPAGIAPLNFNVDDASDRVDVVVRGSRGGELHVNGRYADFDIDRWHRLTQQNRGGRLTITVSTRRDGRWTQYRDFTINVSPYALDDYGLTYRRIAPGYEVGGNIGIYQRNIHTFDEQPIVTETVLPGRCFNCHTANRTNPEQLTMQIRGEGGGTLVQTGGRQRWLDTRTDSTRAAGSYAYWHPSGNYCAYATNTVHQSFFVGRGQRIEVYHKFSNIVVLDVRTNELILSPLLQTDDLEIFPAFSADGRWLYYSTSKPCNVPADYEQVKCSIVRLPFDARTGTFGSEADTIVNARDDNMTHLLARPSYDGRWMMYTVASRSNFTICQTDADLWLMNLKTGERRPLSEVNSPDVESYHNWSANSHWFVFSSKREDGMYARLYLSCIDDKGRAGKPFLLPQRNPHRYYRDMMDSYNCPDFTKTRVNFNAHEAYRQGYRNERKQVKIR